MPVTEPVQLFQRYLLRLNEWKEKQTNKQKNNKKMGQSKLTEVSFDIQTEVSVTEKESWQ